MKEVGLEKCQKRVKICGSGRRKGILDNTGLGSYFEHLIHLEFVA